MSRLLSLLTLFIFISCQDEVCDQKLMANSLQEQAANCGETTGSATLETPGETPGLNSDIEELSPSLEEVPSEATLFDADVTFYGFNETQKSKVEKALELIKKIIRSEEFKRRIEGYTYKGKREFVDNNGKTNEEIYQSLLDASEELLPGRDHTMNLELELYYNRWTSTVGYTTPDTLRIWMNNKFFANYSPAEVAGNIFHEWTHKLGYDHDFNYSESRDHSVPYAVGYLIEELALKY